MSEYGLGYRLGYGLGYALGYGLGYESSWILMFEIDVSPHTLTSARIFGYVISTARRTVCTCVYIQIFFVHNDFVHNVGEPKNW